MKITANIVYTVKFAIALFIYIIAGLVLTLFFAMNFHMQFILILGFFIFVVLPLIYRKPFRSMFTETVRIVFNEKNFIINLWDPVEDSCKREISYDYNDISNCKLNAQRNGYSTLIILFSDGNSSRYTFYDEEENINSSELVYKELITNSGRFSKGSISLSPSFYSSKIGTTLIIFLGIGIAYIIVYQFLNSPRYLPYSFLITIGLFAQIIIARKRDIEIRKRLNK